MSTQFDNELARFHEFIRERLIGGPPISPEEALDLWRAQYPESQEFTESVQAIQEAFADMAAGDVGQPIDDFIGELRRRRNLSNRS